MLYEKFIKKEERERDTWRKERKEKAEKETAKKEKVCLFTREENSYVKIGQVERMLPISNAHCIGETQVGKKEYIVNNEKIALIFNEHAEMTGFFRLPGSISAPPIYFGEGLFAAVSKSKEEVVSFRFGGAGADLGFSISSYFVCAQLEEAESLYADKEYLYVLHRKGVCVLRPVGV